MTRRRHKVTLHYDQLQLLDIPELAPPRRPPPPELCWDCGRALDELRKEKIDHDCAPACKHCGRTYFRYGRANNDSGLWRPYCNCEPNWRDLRPYTWAKSEVPDRQPPTRRRRSNRARR
jgi:hypothetical protein